MVHRLGAVPDGFSRRPVEPGFSILLVHVPGPPTDLVSFSTAHRAFYSTHVQVQTRA